MVVNLGGWKVTTMIPGKLLQLLSSLAIAGLSLFLGSSALANGIEIVVSGGNLGFVASPKATDFDPITISTVRTSSEGALDAFAVRDQRGTGAGWRLQVQALPFTDADGRHTLPLGSLTLSRPTVTADGTTSPAPMVSIPTSGVAMDTAAPVTVATAATDTGMGTYDVEATKLKITWPAAVYAAAYVSTVTISLVSAPE
jgi:hypothetical protein